MTGVITPELHAWARESLRRIAAREAPVRDDTRRPRKLLVVHLDGVPRQLLDVAVRDGSMPFLGRLLASGEYAMDSAFWGSPASTPFFQAGLLYGLEHPNLPAYSWYDRELGRLVKMSIPRDALAIESRLVRSQRNGLLVGGGSAYLSLFRADAHRGLCMSGLVRFRDVARQVLKDLHGVRGPRRHGVGRNLGSILSDSWSAATDALAWGRSLGWDFRHEREFLYNRFFMITLAWRLAHTRVLIDMARGVPAIYLVYGNYDEVAHRRGPFSTQALRELMRVDEDLAELYALSRAREVPYDFYIVTDHGHVNSLPFERRQRRRLEAALLDGPVPPLSADVERGLLDGRSDAAPGRIRPVSERPEVVEAGNFAHVYLTREREPLEADELLQPRYRGVLARVLANPDIGIAVVRQGGGAVALVKGGVYGPDEIDRAPLSLEFSRPALADYLRELPRMPTAGDIVLYGDATAPASTVGFAWEFGSHGGLTRTEVNSIVLWPARGPVDCSGLGHVTQLHQRLSGAYLG
ncbi:MAG: alkaline phosphatase family protein [Myxococcaceae bacterium]|nr:alkaline phosphatase family protein [Myxococcaceae bacterium]